MPTGDELLQLRKATRKARRVHSRVAVMMTCFMAALTPVSSLTNVPRTTALRRIARKCSYRSAPPRPRTSSQKLCIANVKFFECEELPNLRRRAVPRAPASTRRQGKVCRPSTTHCTDRGQMTQLPRQHPRAHARALVGNNRISSDIHDGHHPGGICRDRVVVRVTQGGFVSNLAKIRPREVLGRTDMCFFCSDIHHGPDRGPKTAWTAGFRWIPLLRSKHQTRHQKAASPFAC